MATLSFAQEGKDAYTAGHSRRVSDLSLAIGRKMFISNSETDALRWGSLLHDLGKIAVDQKIMNKPESLTQPEYESIMAHPIVGATMVASVVDNPIIVEMIEYHHFLYNGLGLNQLIKGKDIPLLARIVTVADAFDAMTSERAFRPALSRVAALAEIKLESGTRFDPDIVNIFLDMSSEELRSDKNTVLVTDNEETMRLLIRSVLGSNYNILEASNGQEAIEISLKNSPSLILMDIFMPGKDGLTACYEIKNTPSTRDIPIIMLTGHGEEQNRTLSLKMGASECLTKPFNVVDLIETVERFLKNKQKTVSICR
jgi:putative nucleotidyltransferase with HDIG domain